MRRFGYAIALLLFCTVSSVLVRAACPETPGQGGLSFDLSAGRCSPESQLIPCRCSEGMQWDSVPAAEWYEIQRMEILSGLTTIVGTTRPFNHEAYIDEDGGFHPTIAINYWYFAWDGAYGEGTFPEEGLPFAYTVRACQKGRDGATLCSSEWGNSVSYVASSYYCYDNGALVPCSTSQGASMFDLKNEIDEILAGTAGMHIAIGKKVVAFEDATPIVQIRWFKAQLQEMEANHAPKPKKK